MNKVDRASRAQVVGQLAAAAELEAEAYFPVSARTGEGVVGARRPPGGPAARGPAALPRRGGGRHARGGRGWPSWCASSCSGVTREELPYSIATRVTEWEWPRIRVEIVVERESQKGMVIGKGGSVLKEAGTAARRQLPAGAHLELFVTVDKDWQRRPDRVERLGY